MFEVSYAPSNICDVFTKANSKHKPETRLSIVWKLLCPDVKAESKSRFFFQGLELNFEKNLVNSTKELLKKFPSLFALDDGSRRRLC